MQRSWSLSSHREAGEPPGARAAPSEWIRAFRGQRSTQDPGRWWGQHDVPATGDRTGSCRTLSPEEHRGRLDGRAEDTATTAMLLPPSTSALGGSAVGLSNTTDRSLWSATLWTGGTGDHSRLSWNGSGQRPKGSVLRLGQDTNTARASRDLGEMLRFQDRGWWQETEPKATGLRWGSWGQWGIRAGCSQRSC